LQELPLVVLQEQQKNRIFTKTIFTAIGAMLSVINPNFGSLKSIYSNSQYDFLS
jgi:hypothetical protein